jgi:hypothetical protein
MKRYISAFIVTMPTSSILLVLAYLSKVWQRPRLMELSLALAVLFYLTRLSIALWLAKSTRSNNAKNSDHGTAGQRQDDTRQGSGSALECRAL